MKYINIKRLAPGIAKRVKIEDTDDLERTDAWKWNNLDDAKILHKSLTIFDKEETSNVANTVKMTMNKTVEQVFKMLKFL
jgi:hypothetical protein